MLQRPPTSAQRTPPSATFPSCANSLHSSAAKVVWPSIQGLLDTPERRFYATSCQSTVTANNNNPTRQMYWPTDSQVDTSTHNLSFNEDSGLGDSFFELTSQSVETSMILRPSPVVLRTPFVTNTKNLQSPLRSFFFKPSPPTQTDRPSSLTKSENAIGVRFNGNQLVHLKSPCLLSSIQNQNAPPFNDHHSTDLSHKKPFGQRSPLKPYQTSTRNLAVDLNSTKQSTVETPSKGVKLEYGYEELSSFVSPLKFSQSYSFYNDSFAPEASGSFMDPPPVDLFDHYTGHFNSMDTDSVTLNSFGSSPNKTSSLKNDSLSSFSLSLNSTNESYQSGTMSCSKAIRIKVPRFSSRTKALIYGRTPAQRELTKQANSFWKRNCRPGYKTGIPLCETLEEFSRIDWESKRNISK